MPETLTISLTSIRREVGRLLGISRNYADWSADELQDVADIVASGLRSFYWPVPLGGQRHNWSFLRQHATLSLVSGDRDYDLPANFTGNLLGGFTYATDAKIGKITKTSEEQVRSLWANSEASGAPQYFAIRAKAAASGGETGYEAIFYPVPDNAYSVTGAYEIIPPALELGVNEYHLGGPVHSQTVLEACLAAAEATLDDKIDLHAKKFQDCLAASIAVDSGVMP